jgi:ferredoxin
MPIVTIIRKGEAIAGEVPDGSNLVVLAGIRKFPFPNLRYGCGMAQCTKCKSRILKGAEHLPEPGWKEKKLLGDELAQGFRLACQLRITADLELTQDDARPQEGTA